MDQSKTISISQLRQTIISLRAKNQILLQNLKKYDDWANNAIEATESFLRLKNDNAHENEINEIKNIKNSIDHNKIVFQLNTQSNNQETEKLPDNHKSLWLMKNDEKSNELSNHTEIKFIDFNPFNKKKKKRGKSKSKKERETKPAKS